MLTFTVVARRRIAMLKWMFGGTGAAIVGTLIGAMLNYVASNGATTQTDIELIPKASAEDSAGVQILQGNEVQGSVVSGNGNVIQSGDTVIHSGAGSRIIVNGRGRASPEDPASQSGTGDRPKFYPYAEEYSQ